MNSNVNMNRRHFAALAAGTALTIAARPAWADYTGLPRTFLWNPGFNDIVDTAKYKKTGPYTIGFANASQADLWLVTFTHGVQFAVANHKDKIKKFIATDANGDA